MSTSDLNFALQYFICEVHKCNGELYPPRTQKAGSYSIYAMEIIIDTGIKLQFIDDS